MRFPIVSFNAGELSPQIDARSDVDKYSSGCRILENMIPRIYGGAERRPGTKFIQKVLNGTTVRLLEFEFSNTVAYIIEATDKQFRFYTNGGILLDDDFDPVTVTTPYLAGDLFGLQIKQSNDVMWITHPDYAPRKLTRTSASAFSLDVIPFVNGPFLPRNDIVKDDDVTLSSDSETGTGTLTASSATFEAGHVGALFKLSHPRVSAIAEGSIAGTGLIGAAIPVEGPFTFNTHGIWTATVELQRNENNFGWERYRVFPGANDRNVQLAGNETVDNVQYRINVVAFTSGRVEADLTIDTALQDGIVRVDTFTNDTQVEITILTALASTDATKRWFEGAWSSVRGYPAAITFFEERSVYAGTTEQPQTVWFSATGDFENFKTPIILVASSSFSLTASSDKRNAIRWISALEALIFGTVGGEWRIRSSSLDQPVTPKNFSMKQQTSYGASTLQALQVGDVLLFVDFVGRKVREISWSDDQSKYTAPDLSALAEHITKSGIVSMAYQRNPDNILWTVLGDGTLLSMTYERDQDVIAWAKHPMLPAFGTPATSGSDAVDAVPSTYKYTYLNDSNTVYGVPITDRTMLTLDSGGAAVNIGGGIVGLPCAGNPFIEGEVVRLTGTSNYNGTHTLTAGTTVQQLQFADTFNAETFDGTEIPMKEIASLPTGAGRMAQDSAGNLYVAHDERGSEPNIFYITRIAPDGTETPGHEFLDTTWIDALNGFSFGIKITPDDRYLYLFIRLSTASKHGDMSKFDLTDGSEVWHNEDGDATFGGHDMDIDLDGNAYAAFTAGGMRKYDTDTGVDTVFPTMEGAHVVHVDDELNIVCNAGAASGGSNLWVMDLGNNLIVDEIMVGSSLIGTTNLTSDGQFIYVVNGTTLSKVNWDGKNLSLVTSVSVTVGQGIYIDLFDNLVIVNQDTGGGQDEVLWFYDKNLNFLSKTSGMSTSMLASWASAVGGSWQSGEIVFNGALGSSAVGAVAATAASDPISASSVAVIPGETEDEVWLSVTRPINGQNVVYIEQFQPRDWGDDDEDAWFVDSGLKYEGPAVTTLTQLEHLEGEEVAVYGNGAVFARQTVVNGEITPSESVTKAIVGIPFRYKLKPMRSDVNIQGGNTKGSIKKVTEVVLSFLNAGNVQYGTDMNDLRTIDWRTTENYDNPPALFTGDVGVVFDGGFTVEDSVLITSDDPLPCTLRAMVLRSKITGR